jgi:predicted nucleotidyltransferase
MNWDETVEHLHEKYNREKQQSEEERKKVLERTVRVLEGKFEGSGVEVYLVGSLIRPHKFNSESDIDIVLKNFKGDPLDIWTELDHQFEHPIEIILFEKCRFQEFITSQGLKVI